jgi:hypothetical protein
MSKAPHKMHEWHYPSDEQERRRVVNKKRRKRMKNLNRQAKLCVSEHVKRAREVPNDRRDCS